MTDDMIPRTEALAMVAAEREAITQIDPCWHDGISGDAHDKTWREMQQEIRARTDPDALAALEAVKEEARQEERERCAIRAARQVGDWNYVGPEVRAWHMDNVAAAIRSQEDGE